MAVLTLGETVLVMLQLAVLTLLLGIYWELRKIVSRDNERD